MNVDDGKLRALPETQAQHEADIKEQMALKAAEYRGRYSQAKPLGDREVEVKLTEEQFERYKQKTGIAFCTSCGEPMNAVKGKASTGLCLKCSPSSRFVEVQPNGSQKLIRRVDRRTSKKARRIQKRHGKG